MAIITVPFYILWVITQILLMVGFAQSQVTLFLLVWVSGWFAWLYLFAFKTRRGKRLRQIWEKNER